MKLKTRIISINDINAAIYNPRVDLKPDDSRYKSIEYSLKTYGYLEPLVWNEATKTLVSGHQRLKIMIASGESEVEVSVVNLSLEREKQLNLTLNKVRGDWNEEMLAALVDELSRMPNFDLADIGFDQDELSEILDQNNNQDLDDDFDVEAAVEAITQPVTKRGDVLRLGEHIIMCGDSSNPDDLKTLMGDDKAVLFNTDFPYKVAYGKKNNRPNSSARSIKLRASKQIHNDDMPQADYEVWVRKIMTAVNEYLKPGAVFYIWQGHRQIPPLYQILLDLEFHTSSLICWLKESPSISFADYSFRSEHALYGWKLGGPHYWAGPPCTSNVFEINRDRGEYWHPTQKPIELGVKAITYSSKREDIVLDVFLGGAGLLLACETLGRKCRGMELDERYVDVAVYRYAQLVGWDKVSPEIKSRYMKEAGHVR